MLTQDKTGWSFHQCPSAPDLAEGEGARRAGIDNENDQVSEGHLVDALAARGDEGRDTLR